LADIITKLRYRGKTTGRQMFPVVFSFYTVSMRYGTGKEEYDECSGKSCHERKERGKNEYNDLGNSRNTPNVRSNYRYRILDQ
jgi:hypothetical protein